MNLEPLNDRIIVKPLAEPEHTEGGIIIPDVAKEKPTRGEVYAVGPGKMKDDGSRIPLRVSHGDIVLYGKYAGTSITVNGEDYILLREDEVFARELS
jgi:chaperonin GroES